MSSGIFFDARYIQIAQHDGISRFSAGLLKALNNQIDVTAVISDLRQLEKLPKGIKFVKVTSPTSIFEPLVALQLNKLGAKKVFSPMQTIGSFGRKFKLVLTVHDLIYYRHPTPPPSFNLAVKLLWRLYHLTYAPQRLLLNRADAIATVSQTTKNLIAKHRLTTKPVQVVYNAASDGAQSTAKREAPVSKYLVYMGSFMKYKNVEVLIAGMQHLPGYELHLLSRITSVRKTELQQLIQQNDKVIFHNGVSENEYLKILNGATALVTGSRDEGFGIPLVEAMSLGIPTVVSEIEIFQEIGGEAAVYFNQESPKSFAEAVLSIESSPRWLEVSKLSQDQAKKFNWSSSANTLIKLLENL
jgi:glycosyltransferase involved in cell wall biosynthesis